MAERKQNWYQRFTKWFGPSLYLEAGSPLMGLGGLNAFTLFSTTKRGKKFSLGMKESGLVSLNADAALEIIAGEENDDGGEDILIHSRNGTIDIKVNKNGDVRIHGSNVSVTAEALIELDSRVVRIRGDDEISLDAPYIHSRGKRGNLVPRSFLAQATFGSFIGSDVLGGFVDQAADLAAGLGDLPISDLADQANTALSGIQDQLPGMKDQLLEVGGELENVAGELAPQLEALATSPEVTQLGAALKDQAGAFANFGQGLVPTGY